MNQLLEFSNSYFLWREAMLAGAITGAICGFLGVYVVLRRIIFVSAALTQISSFGVTLAFYLESMAAGLLVPLVNPFFLSLVLTIICAYLFAIRKDYQRISQEGIIGFGFLIASAGVVIIGDKITKGAHDVADIVFGAAVVVAKEELYVIISVALIIFVLHMKYFKDFIFVSYDSEMASLHKYPVKLLNSALLISIGLMIAVSTRALGALPVFGLLALPPLSALLISERLRFVILISVIIGLSSAVFGYFFSFIFDLPTGATICLVASSIFLISYIVKNLR